MQNMNFKSTFKGKDSKTWFIIGLVFLVIIYEIGITDIQVPTIVHDEIGYWAGAAYYAGYDWSGSLSYMSYFGYGAGLILSLFMRAFKEPVVVYQVVMQFFVLLLALSYFMAYMLARDLFPDISRFFRVTACVAAVCYPTYIMNARIAWSEHFLFFFTWVNLFVFHSYIKKPNCLKIILCSISLGYLYMLHQRTIGMVILIFLYIIYLVIKSGKVRKLDFLIFTFCLIVMLFVHRYLKLDIQQNLWYKLENKSVSVSGNDYGGRVKSFFYVIRNYGIQAILVSFFGKSFYIVVGSIGVLIESAIFFVHCIKRVWIDKEIHKSDYSIIYVYLLVAGAIGLNIIATMGVVGRVDGLIYGRYMEHAFSPLIMIGICSLSKRQIKGKYIAAVNLFIMVLCLIVYYIYNVYNFSGYLGVCAGGTLWAYSNVGEFDFVFFSGLITALVLTLLYICWNKDKVKYLGVIIVIALYSMNGIYLREQMKHIEDNNKSMIPLADRISNVGIEAEIYVVRGELPYAYLYMEVLQYLLPEYKMFFIQNEDIGQLNGNYYLMVEEEKDEYEELHECIGTEYIGWKIYIPQNSELKENILDMGK